MTFDERKDLLLKDLCARLPYGVIMTNIEFPETHYPLTCKDLHDIMYEDLDDVPYLRPLSSMTEEEKKELRNLSSCICESDICGCDYADYQGLQYTVGGCVDKDTFIIKFQMIEKVTNWLNKKMFDYRGLIPAGAAIEVTESNNPYKE